MHYHLMNVFTSADAQSGNQLAVVLTNHALSDQQMQQITLNFNFSETVFLTDMQDMRIFTPGGELPFAGHPTIGTANLVAKLTGLREFVLETKRGPVPVKVEGDKASLIFPGEVRITNYTESLADVMTAAQLNPNEVVAGDVRMVNSGPYFVVIPVKSLAALRNAVSPRTLERYERHYLIHEASPEKFYVRMFSPKLGIGEDAATGSAACALAGYLHQVHQRNYGSVQIFQGAEINRPSEISLSWAHHQIEVAGRVRLWGEGLLK